jgi:fructose-1,6-bisphosphatase I
MEAIVLAIKMIAKEVRRSGLNNIRGFAGYENTSGDRVTKLDEYAHNCFLQTAMRGKLFRALASEEYPELIKTGHKSPDMLFYDPLDGSSNTDVNNSIGSIFAIRRGEGKFGDEQILAGYAIYGPSTMLVYTTTQGVHGFTLDSSIGEFILSHPDMKIPEHNKAYSVNEGNYYKWDTKTKKFIDQSKKNGDSLRYVGTLVADFHRTLIKGGIFLYPASPKPKLRLLYEAAPMAKIVEHAGGAAIDGNQRILDMVPEDLHQKVPLIIGSPDNVNTYKSTIGNVVVR